VLLVASLIGRRRWVVGLAVLVGLGTMLVAPAVAAGWLSAGAYGPFDTPFENPLVAYYAHTLQLDATHLSAHRVAALARARGGARYLVGGSSGEMSADELATGADVLPIGGFTGRVPWPSVAQIERAVADGEVHLMYTAAGSSPQLNWIRSHCEQLGQSFPGNPAEVSAAYWCTPDDATSG
jgi:hypothetical protein